MRVKDCNHCKHCKRRTWSQRYVPSSGRAVGFTHAYAYCAKHQTRVADVKKCEEKETR